MGALQGVDEPLQGIDALPPPVSLRSVRPPPPSPPPRAVHPTASRRSGSTTARRMGTGGLTSGTGRTRAAYAAT